MDQRCFMHRKKCRIFFQLDGINHAAHLVSCLVKTAEIPLDFTDIFLLFQVFFKHLIFTCQFFF